MFFGYKYVFFCLYVFVFSSRAICFNAENEA